jgi:prevent-host-death family protein
MSYTDVRNHLSEVLTHVCSSHEPVVIERRRGGNSVVLSEDDWKSLQETIYLMSSKKDWEAITEHINVEECSDSSPW